MMLPTDIILFLACKTAQIDDVADRYHFPIGLQDVAARYHIHYGLQDCSHGCRPMTLLPDNIFFWPARLLKLMTLPPDIIF
jgi:hypothetical protein